MQTKENSIPHFFFTSREGCYEAKDILLIKQEITQGSRIKQEIKQVILSKLDLVT